MGNILDSFQRRGSQLELTLMIIASLIGNFEINTLIKVSGVYLGH